MNEKFWNLLKEQKAGFYFDEPMHQHTTFHIGGKADCLCEVGNAEALRNILQLCKEYEVPYFILGMGSNLLVSDDGIRGLVIRLTGEFTNISLMDAHTVRCGAGVTLAGLCVFARKVSLGGLEFAWGIPGSVGGAVYMNAGAYGGEIKDVAVEARYMNTQGEVQTLRQKELDFGYRHSAFTDTKHIILDAVFRLAPKRQEDIIDRMQELMDKRKTNQPINHYSAGSVFKRPKDGYAAALIEECGLKGCTIGGASVSPKHSGFIVNDNHASAEDVKQLIRHIQQVVKEQKGVDLCCEVKFVG